MANDNILGGILGGLGIIGLAAIAAAGADSTTSSSSTGYTPTPIATPRYDRNRSYDPYTRSTTSVRSENRRVDPRAYEVPSSSYMPSAVDTWIQRNQSALSTIGRVCGYVDERQVAEIGNAAIRMGSGDKLYIYRSCGRLYMVDSSILSGDRNAKAQLKEFFRTNPMMRVVTVTKSYTSYFTTTTLASTVMYTL